MNTRTPCFGYMSEIAGLIDMVERGCARFRRIGGGGLVREYRGVPQKNVTKCEHERMNAYVREGRTIAEICALTNRSKAIVAVHTRETRNRNQALSTVATNAS
jgi:hypothetical protein